MPYRKVLKRRNMKISLKKVETTVGSRKRCTTIHTGQLNGLYNEMAKKYYSSSKIQVFGVNSNTRWKN